MRDFTTIGNKSQRERRAAIKGSITDSVFVNKLQECIKILHAIDTLIKVFQSNAVPCSNVYNALLDRVRNNDL